MLSSALTRLSISRFVQKIVAIKCQSRRKPEQMARWSSGIGRRTHNSRVGGSPPGHDTAWLFISETGDRFWRVNCPGNYNHHLGQLSLTPLRGR